MSFIRLKKRKLKDKIVFYAYLVKNKWSKKYKSPRQTVSKYLGKVYDFNKINEDSFIEFKKIDSLEDYVLNRSKSEIINDLIDWKIYQYNLNVDFKKSEKRILIDNKEAVIKINDGFLCSHYIGKLHRFNSKHTDPHYIGVDLATAFTQAGIDIPKELFVLIFDKFGGTVY
jgi:hypothetical protein